MGWWMHGQFKGDNASCLVGCNPKFDQFAAYNAGKLRHISTGKAGVFAMESAEAMESAKLATPRHSSSDRPASEGCAGMR